MSRAVAAVFGILVAATFAAFFVAQRLKHQPSLIQGVKLGPALFSPNQDGRKDRVHLTFKVKSSDDVTVQILDTGGDAVRTLLDDRRLKAYRPIDPSLSWDGRDDDGIALPDGRYRVRITLRHQGRSVIYPRSIVKDTTAPRPLVTSVGPRREYGPELLPEPGGGPAVVHFLPAQLAPRALVFKTAPGRPRQVLEAPLRPGDTSWTWDGRTEARRRVSPGTYLVVVQWRDRAGNVGSSVPLDRAGLPVLGRGRLPGRGGITVRYLAARPPVEPAKARDPLVLAVDARQQRFTWDLRRVGASGPRKRGGPKTFPRVTTRAPGGVSGAYLFEVHTRARRTAVVVPVQARRSRAGTAQDPRGVLVVLPVITWQGADPVDDDGDGAPNVLTLGTPSRLERVAGTPAGLPAGFGDQQAPLLTWLDRTGRRYDLTTDAALLAGRGPVLAGHRGVLIAGDSRWLPGDVRRRLRAFARAGGTVASTGTDSLRRTVALDRRGRLVNPSPDRATDLFGARIRPLVRHPTNLEVFKDDELQLFTGTTGVLADVPVWEETAGLGPDAQAVATAVTVDPPGKPVVVAARFGKGLVIRPGFPSFASRLATDPAVSALMARTWTLLSR